MTVLLRCELRYNARRRDWKKGSAGRSRLRPANARDTAPATRSSAACRSPYAAVRRRRRRRRAATIWRSAAEMGENVGLGHARARLGDDDQQRALVPLRVRHADHRRLVDAGAADRGVLEVDRADPFAARLDDVLRPVDDPHIAERIDRRDVAGIEPAVGVDRRRSPRRNRCRRSTARGPAAARRRRRRAAARRRRRRRSSSRRRTCRGPAWPASSSWSRGGQRGDLGRRRADGADRRHLGHPPQLADGDAARGERLDHRPRHRRAADVDPPQPPEPAAVASRCWSTPSQIVGTASAKSTPSSTISRGQRRRVEMRAVEHQRRPRRGGGIGHAPRVGVEHRRDRQHDRLARRAPARRRRTPPSHGGRSSGGCRARPWDCRSCRWYSTARPARISARSAQAKSGSPAATSSS